LLHDIGHLLGGAHEPNLGVIDHDRAAMTWLRERGFSERLVALVSGHVDAKRYLVTTKPGYYDRLSETSKRTLELQGGRMSAAEATKFEERAEFLDLLRLRTWDELAKDPAIDVAQLENYRPVLEAATDCHQEPTE